MLKARYLYCFILLLQEKHISLHRYIIGLFPPTNYDFPSVYMAEVFLLKNKFLLITVFTNQILYIPLHIITLIFNKSYCPIFKHL